MNDIEIRLRHRFERFTLEVDFRTPSQGVTALFGPSGAGKSTIIEAIAGLFAPQSGYVRVGDDVLLDTQAGQHVPVHERRIGYVFQDARLFPHLTVRDNCLFGARRAQDKPGPPVVDQIVSLLDLDALLDRYPARLSGGERQRVAIARALLSSPRLLLLDEPLASLDQARKQEVLPYLERLQTSTGLPVIFVSHSRTEVTRLAQRIVVLERGAVRAQGDIAEVLGRPDLFPVHGPIEAGAIIDGIVVAHEDVDQLSEVSLQPGTLWLPRLDRDVGSAVRLQIRARDVIIALEAPGAISANNVLKGKIKNVASIDGAYAEVQIDCGACRLLASVTQRSIKRLDLQAGREVYAIIKTVNLG